MWRKCNRSSYVTVSIIALGIYLVLVFIRVGDENGFQAMKMAFKDFPPFPLTKSLCQSGVKKHSISA